MRLYLDTTAQAAGGSAGASGAGERMLLDPAPLTAAEVTRARKYRLKCRRLVEGPGPNGTLELKPVGNFTDFAKVTGRLAMLADSLGCALEVDPELERRFAAMRELAEEHYRAGNEIKREDPKYAERREAFARVVNEWMVRPLKPRQMTDAFFLATMARAGNFSVPGSGKTATVLGAFAFLRAQDKVSRLLVVCPKNAFDSWRTEWVACFGNRLPLRCASTQDREFTRLGKADRRGYVRSRLGGYNLVLANYDATPGIAEELGALAASGTMLVFDEVHRVKRVGGKQATAALAISAEAPYTFALTGTPLPNTYEDLYNFLHILYPHEYDNFFGFEIGELRRADENEQVAINERIQPFFCRTTKADLGVPPADPDRLVEVEADGRTDRLLHVLRARYRKNKLTLMLRVLQMENDPMDLLEDLDPEEYRWILEEDDATGGVDVVDYSDQIVDMIRSTGVPFKQERCLRLVEDLAKQGRPVIVWCIFTKSMADLKAGLARRGVEAHVIEGDVLLADRTRVLDDFRAGRFPVLITNPHTLAESVSLHSVCHDAVYYEYSFNLVHLLQSKDRIHRLGLPADQHTRYYYLVQDYQACGTEARRMGAAAADAGMSREELGRWSAAAGGSDPLAGWSMDRQIYERLRMKEDTMLRAIDAELIETQPTSDEDLDAIFAGLFDDEASGDGGSGRGQA